jgi:hypothetical protein
MRSLSWGQLGPNRYRRHLVRGIPIEDAQSADAVWLRTHNGHDIVTWRSVLWRGRISGSQFALKVNDVFQPYRPRA